MQAEISSEEELSVKVKAKLRALGPGRTSWTPHRRSARTSQQGKVHGAEASLGLQPGLARGQADDQAGERDSGPGAGLTDNLLSERVSGFRARANPVEPW